MRLDRKAIRQLVALTIALVFAIGLPASADPQLSLGNVEVEPGATGSLALSLSGGTEPYAGMNAKILVPDGVSVSAVSLGALLPSASFEVHWQTLVGTSENGVTVVAYSPAATFAGAGVLLDVELQVDPAAANGSYVIGFATSDVNPLVNAKHALSNAAGTVSVAHTTVDGNITIGVSGCGDGEIGADEVCDGNNLGAATCEDQGFDGGELACATNCLDFDTMDCFNDGTCSGTEVGLNSGWNMIGPAVDLDYLVADICQGITDESGDPQEVNRWNNGGWDSHLCALPFLNNFAIESGRGYFVRVQSNSNWCQQGSSMPSPLCVPWADGWNSLSLPPWAVDYTASVVCEQLEEQGCQAIEIDRWYNGGWDSHLCSLSFLNDFPMTSGAGYFVRTTGCSEFCMSRGSVRTSNIKDVSFTVSWTTDAIETCQVNYGASPILGSTAPDDRGPAFADDTHHVTLSGLSADTLYYFDLECDGIVDDNGGVHYSQRTGATLSSVPSADSISGQVFKSDSTTPAAGAIVYVHLQDQDGSGSAGRSTLLSWTIEDGNQGFWLLNLGNARTEDLSSTFAYSASGDLNVQEADGAADGRASNSVDTGSDDSSQMVLESTAPASATSSQSLTRRARIGARGKKLVSRFRLDALSRSHPVDVSIVDGPYFANQTDTAFTVVWESDVPSLGRLRVTDADGVVLMIGDARGEDHLSRVHYVVVDGLAPESIYEVEMVAGGAGSWNAQTGPTLAVPASRTRFGKLSAGSDAQVVLVTMRDSIQTTPSYLASLVVDNHWIVNLSTVRLPGLAVRPEIESGAELELKILGETSRELTEEMGEENRRDRDSITGAR